MRKRTADFLVRMAQLRRVVFAEPGPYSSRRDWEASYLTVPCAVMRSGFYRIEYSTYNYYAGG